MKASTGLVVATFLLTAVMVIGAAFVMSGVIDTAATSRVQSDLAACERGNVIREAIQQLADQFMPAEATARRRR